VSYQYQLNKNTYFHVNSDLSGCQIFRDGISIVEIEKETLLQIVSDYVMSQKISKLEQQTPTEILGITTDV